jgi:predicted nucleic acid-binding protein
VNALVDTNVLLRLADENHAMHAAASAAIEALRRTRTLCVFPQNLYEFWVVATRPVKDNGLGYSQDEALAAISGLETFYLLLPETSNFFSQWKSLLHEFNDQVGALLG